MPDDLRDCKIYQLTDDVLNPILYITKCPLSKTSTTKELTKYQPEPKIIQMNGKRYMEIYAAINYKQSQ